MTSVAENVRLLWRAFWLLPPPFKLLVVFSLYLAAAAVGVLLAAIVATVTAVTVGDLGLILIGVGIGVMMRTAWR